jgi:hypothetical protein
MLQRGLELDPAPVQTSLFPPPPAPAPTRFARPAAHFAARRPTADGHTGNNGGAA